VVAKATELSTSAGAKVGYKVIVECAPPPWSAFTQMTSYPEVLSAELNLTVYHFVKQSQDDNYLKNGVKLPYTGPFGGDRLSFQLSAPPPPSSPPPPLPPPSPSSPVGTKISIVDARSDTQRTCQIGNGCVNNWCANNDMRSKAQMSCAYDGSYDKCDGGTDQLWAFKFPCKGKVTSGHISLHSGSFESQQLLGWGYSTDAIAWTKMGGYSTNGAWCPGIGGYSVDPSSVKDLSCCRHPNSYSVSILLPTDTSIQWFAFSWGHGNLAFREVTLSDDAMMMCD